MPSQKELDICYMSVAWSHAILSKANRKKVGACLVTKSGILIPGYNGQPVGSSNECEYLSEDGNILTKPTTLHAELNCILKAAKEGVSIVDSVLYVTLSPCLSCSAMLLQAGVRQVVYDEAYRDEQGIIYLKEHSVLIRKFSA